MKTNYFEMVEKATTHNKAMKVFKTIEKNTSDGSKALAFLFYKMKNDNLFTESSFSKFLENHKEDFKDFANSTIYNYANCYEYVISKEWAEQLNFGQCYELTKAVKNGSMTEIVDNIDIISSMSVRDLKKWVKGLSAENGATEPESDNSKRLETDANINNNVSIKDSIKASMKNCEIAINKGDKELFKKEWSNLKKFVEMI